jgi:hypothetical protein
VIVSATAPLGTGRSTQRRDIGVSGDPVLVIGATGRQGGSVLRHLVERNRRVRAFTRDASDPRATAMEVGGVELAQGDMEDPASLERAMRGVAGVYSVQDFWSVGAVAEVRQGTNVADAARRADVPQLATVNRSHNKDSRPKPVTPRPRARRRRHSQPAIGARATNGRLTTARPPLVTGH